MLRLVLLVCFVAAAAAVPVESDTEFCNGQTECPQDCGYVSRNEKCVFCRCGDSPLVQPPEPVPLPEPEPLSCQHGQSFIDECDNDCKCIADGKYGCTRKLCKPGQTSEKPKTCSGADGLPKRTGQRVFCHEGIVKTQPSDADCLPGSVFKDKEDCNTCRCSDAGVAACTLKFCVKPLPGPEGPTCEHGQSFIDECDNDCKCIADGKYGCTRKLCKPGQTSEKPKTCSGADGLPKRTGQRVFCHEGIVKTQPSDAKCLPGSVFKDKEDCNTCRCSDSGAEACTLKACIDLRTDSSCSYGPGFIDECNNDCTCVNNEFYGCTFKACKPGERPEVPMRCTSSDNLPSRAGAEVVCEDGIVKLHEKKCRYGDEYIDECDNNCRCLEGKYACTRKECRAGQISMMPMSCSGTADLPYRANRRVFCHDGIVKVQDNDETCLAGAVFNDECNECFCSDTGKSGCTLKACVGEESESTVTCEDGLPECPQDCGQSYNKARDCYDCPCAIGNPGDVTVMPGEPCPPGTVLTESGPFFSTCGPSTKCPHGLEFIDECGNDCTCGGDGYGCTYKACQPGQTGAKPMTCTSSADLPERKGKRVFCHDGIVKLQNKEDSCIPKSLFKEDCNSCFCGEQGQMGCTLKECAPKQGACAHGKSFIDECDNDCECVNGEFYGCTRKACKPGQTAEEPKTCSGADDLPQRAGRRVMCHEGIVKTQEKDAECLPGSTYKEECNTCTCGGACTLKACIL
ncbi:SCO-spondin-like isoform X2 [Amphibalanus amphitrite]|uniref:SCO-spondin-like isoform X2 n=1 Tax=Amphibalanus amphitrite TaxID=1232801 RepID=UPI001C8FA9BA|nr:SCO-spondin-like isoform X2 [Amphibalanus amphitrite]